MKTPGHKVNAASAVKRKKNGATTPFPVACGTCCDKCNREVVIPTRLKMAFPRKTN